MTRSHAVEAGSATGCPVSAVFERGRRRWPGLGMTLKQFEAVVDQRALESATSDRLHAEDLFVACAAVAGRPAAVEVIEATIRRQVAIALRSSADPSTLDEIRQRVTVRLLCGDERGSGPRLAQYRGSASLRAWLRVIATRELYRVGGRTATLLSAESAVERAVSPAHTPLGALVGREQRELFKSAFQAAFAALSLHDRNLLRQHYGDGVSIGELAQMHRVHRATMARQLARVRLQVRSSTQRRLRDKLPGRELSAEGIAVATDSQLEVSLSRMFSELPRLG